jgi:hypothetical protein
VSLEHLAAGAPGFRQGTQAKLISKTYGIPQIATGDMIREIKELDTELGRRVKAIYDRGELVDDATIVDLIESRLDRGDTIPASPRRFSRATPHRPRHLTRSSPSSDHSSTSSSSSR